MIVYSVHEHYNIDLFFSPHYWREQSERAEVLQDVLQQWLHASSCTRYAIILL